jgi:CPA2 family monovalent cation:H+ antiporter-2
LIGWLHQRSFVKVYSIAQAALVETFAESPGTEHIERKVLPPLLRDANLQTVVISGNSPVVGKRIYELQLRAKSGASIIGIDRKGASIVNPGPDEELQAGDEVLLLGSRTQLEAARRDLPA